MMIVIKNKAPRILSLAALAAVLTGCNITGAMTPPSSMPAGVALKVGKGAQFTAPNSNAGIPVPAATDSGRLAMLVKTRNAGGAFGVPRSDPFALTAEEKNFENQQTVERFFAGNGGFGTFVTAKEDTDEVVEPLEPQPYRRLSGIVVGDSVLAILEEEGKTPIIVTPGMMIPNSPWRVVSIDQDKAILRRSGKTKPNQIIVRLEQPRFNPAAQGGGGNFPGGPPGGGNFPGGPPGGFGPGGPSGGPAGRGD